MSDQPYLDVPGKGHVPLSEFDNVVKQEILQYEREHPEDLDEILKPLEKDTILYLRDLMGAAAKATDRKNIYNALAQTGGFNVDLSKGGSGAFGVYVQNLLGLPIQFPQPPQSPLPDTPREDASAIEVKTRRKAIYSTFSITVASITAYGGKVEGSILNDTEIKNLNDRYENENLLMNVALHKMMFKMQNFLYMRVLDKSQQQKYHGRAYSSSGPQLEVVAFILFMRLLIKKVEELIREKRKDQFRISVHTKNVKQDQNSITFQTQYEVELLREEVPLSERLSATGRLIKELEFIRKLYAVEYDFINKLEATHWKDARAFYRFIKKDFVRRFRFSKLEI